MQCPRDGTALESVVVLRVEIDKCHTCDGLWFDHGELERIRAAKVSDLESHIEEEFGNPSTRPGETKGFMRCPKCDDGRLQKTKYSFAKSGVVEIDRCESCFGFWIDKGELDGLTNRPEDNRDADVEQLASTRLSSFVKSIGRIFG